MKKFFCAAILCFGLFFFAGVSHAQQDPTLPDVAGWHAEPLRSVTFDAVSGRQGIWLERNYRMGGVPIKATWIGGKGPNMWLFPKAGIDANDGPIGSGCTYKTVQVADNLAIAEHHPVLGRSLVTRVHNSGTLTLESVDATEENMIAAMTTLLGAAPQ